MYPPFCIICGSKAHWNCDYSAEDFGYECEGVIGCYSCSNDECNTHIEVRDLYIGEESEERSIKYYKLDEDNEYKEVENTNTEIEHCLYCSTTLDTTNSKPSQNNDEAVIVNKICNHCDTSYEIETIYPTEDIYRGLDDPLEAYELTTIIVK